MEKPCPSETACCSCIEEPLNTLSNIGFIVLGIVGVVSSGTPLLLSQTWETFKLIETQLKDFATLTHLNLLLIACGVCSAFHHACRPTWKHCTILVDWLPIACSLTVACYDHPHLLAHVSASSWVLVSIAFAFLISDHVCTPLPVPYGHVLWHLCAAFALGRAYEDMWFAIHSDYCNALLLGGSKLPCRATVRYQSLVNAAMGGVVLGSLALVVGYRVVIRASTRERIKIS